MIVIARNHELVEENTELEGTLVWSGDLTRACSNYAYNVGAREGEQDRELRANVSTLSLCTAKWLEPFKTRFTRL